MLPKTATVGGDTASFPNDQMMKFHAQSHSKITQCIQMNFQIALIEACSRRQGKWTALNSECNSKSSAENACVPAANK